MQKSVRAVAEDLAELLKKGRYTKVRIKLGKRQILPEHRCRGGSPRRAG